MKTIMTGFVALFLLFFSFTFVLAQNETFNASANDTVQAIISGPEEINNISESEASGNLFWKNFDIWFTFNQEKKAEKELRLAELQLVRARIAERNNNTPAMEKALEAHRVLIDRVKGRIARFDNTTGNITKLVGLERAIEVHELRINRLNYMLNNSNLSADEAANIQARINQAENNTQHLKEVAMEKRERIEQRIANKTGEPIRERDMNRTRNETFNESMPGLNLSGEAPMGPGPNGKK